VDPRVGRCPRSRRGMLLYTSSYLTSCCCVFTPSSLLCRWLCCTETYLLYRGFVLLPSKIVLLDPLHGATLRLRRWPPPLGPPTDLMPGHLSPACGLTTLNATHLRDGQSRRSSSLRELGISIVRAVRASTPDLLRAWCRSLAGRQPLGLGEDVGRVGGSAQRAQQLGGLQGHDTN